MMPIASPRPDRRHDPRHEPDAVSRATIRRGACCSTGRWWISPRGAPTPIITVSESAKRDIVRLYGLVARARARRARGGGAVVPAGPRPRRARARAPALRAGRSLHPVRRHDRAAEEPADADRGLRGAAASRRSAASARLRGPVRMALAATSRHASSGCGSPTPCAFTGYVPFEDLPALYSLAEMFVFPSLYEGFGLPVIEAMACGTPVITGHVAGAGGGGRRRGRARRARSTPTRSARRWSRLARSREPASSSRRSGCGGRATFSWERAARETLDVYRRWRGDGWRRRRAAVRRRWADVASTAAGSQRLGIAP